MSLFNKEKISESYVVVLPFKLYKWDIMFIGYSIVEFNKGDKLDIQFNKKRQIIGFSLNDDKLDFSLLGDNNMNLITLSQVLSQC